MTRPKLGHDPARWTGFQRALYSLVGLLMLSVLAPEVSADGKTPDWVEHHGVSKQYPTAAYVTGYGVASGPDAVTDAKQQASADLARRILVRIESEVSDVRREEDGDYSYKLAAVTRSTTDVRLSNLAYEPLYVDQGEAHALAWIDRKNEASSRAEARDLALATLRTCLEAAFAQKEAGRQAEAIRTFQSCQLPIAEALQHDSIAAAMRPNAPRDRAPFEELTSASRRIDREVESIRQGPSRDLRTAADAMAQQLSEQGVSTDGRLVVPHFNYGSTNFSSSFGRVAGIELERALARAIRSSAPTAAGAKVGTLAVQGIYLEDGDSLRLIAIARDIESGRLIGSAEAHLALSAVPSRLELKPANYGEALEFQRLLAGAEIVSGELSVEISTDKGRGGVLYAADEELKVYLRVNRPAWVRLIYILSNGAKVPLEQGYYVDASKVNRVVEYPDSFLVREPFGVEMLHATAFTTQPPLLATKHDVIGGHDYEVLAEGLRAVSRTRGLARKHKLEIAEDFVTVTTTPAF